MPPLDHAARHAFGHAREHVDVQRAVRFERGITPSIGQEREVERETGFEPATFCLGSRHSAN